MGSRSNDYDYVDADPVNSMDLDGLWGPKWLKKAVRVAGYVSVGVCVIGTAGACGAVALAAFGGAAVLRTGGFIASKSYRTKSGWGRYSSGLALDFATTRITALRGPTLRWKAKHARGQMIRSVGTIRSALRTGRGRARAAGLAATAAYVRSGY